MDLDGPLIALRVTTARQVPVAIVMKPDLTLVAIRQLERELLRIHRQAEQRIA
jgi:hypothetical protein